MQKLLKEIHTVDGVPQIRFKANYKPVKPVKAKTNWLITFALIFLVLWLVSILWLTFPGIDWTKFPVVQTVLIFFFAFSWLAAFLLFAINSDRKLS